MSFVLCCVVQGLERNLCTARSAVIVAQKCGFCWELSWVTNHCIFFQACISYVFMFSIDFNCKMPNKKELFGSPCKSQEFRVT